MYSGSVFQIHQKELVSSFKQISMEATSPTGIKRPGFLTVLCILSFIGSCYFIFSGVTTYMNADASSQMISSALDSAREEVKKEVGTDDRAGQMADKMLSGVSKMSDPKLMKQNALYMILANILSLGGAYLMFQQRKMGFWIYLLGTAIFILSPIIVFGATNLMSLGMTFLYGLVGVVFAVLYALNLKHMR
jgi:hypothetical protein